jgi:DNA-binding PucR family transcriptional regulator
VELRQILATLDGEPGTCVASGDLGQGIEGFRGSFEQARMAQRVGVQAGSDVTFYRDVALEALALHGDRHARRFVSEELGPMMAEDAKTTEQRRTLEAYFAAGSNASSCAAALGVHEQTVAYRLRRIEERLGYVIAERRAELHVALRLLPLVTERRQLVA